MVATDARDEIVTLILERPMVAVELGLMAEEDFLELMRSAHYKLKQQSMITLGGLPVRRRAMLNFEDILAAAKRVSVHGF